MRNRITAGLAVVATAAFLAIPAGQALASSADPPTCTARYTCMYQATSSGGPEQDYYNPDQGGQWINLPIGERSSVISGGSSDVWFWNESAGLYTCVPGHGSNDDLTFPGGYGDPGWMYIDYGVTQNCAEDSPDGAPGT
jgi:hypothetical protein